MNRNRHCVWRRPALGRLFLGVALAAGTASECRALAAAPQAQEPQPWPEAETVLTLLRADAAAALADCRVPGLCAPGGQSSALATSAPPRRDDIRVAAIFGTARSLSVDVVVNGALLRYRAGRADPVEGAVTMDAYRLLTIDGACVRLHRDGRDHTACLDAGGVRP
ncbi:hypothetical protein [Achromobacter deleyi]|uniref:hypothetical protein n=1 Tax=Achromobacter deleyi TaxID=1353891 RepID=UPI0014911892|nr:hypothetical protein [Achromobacter deleyi]QVQ29197.1 hypothetical protein HLG70_12670 [Achromobacter deleyi]UIP19317.1 hypothetical protein LYZ39_20270 [Achromobacter deleyi]